MYLHNYTSRNLVTKEILTMTPAVQGVLLLLCVALAVCQAHAAEPIIQVTMVIQRGINMCRQVV